MTDTRDRPCTLRARDPEALDDGVLRLIDRVRREHVAPIRIADLADLSDATKPCVYDYSWDRPVGLVVAERPGGGLLDDSV